MLAVLFGTFAAPQRLKALLPLCQRWSVPVPSGDGEGCDQDVCRLAMERLAAKVCGVIKKSVSGDSIEGGLRTMSLSEGAVIWSDGALRLRRFSVERAGLLGELHRRSGFCQASLSTAEGVWWMEEDPVATIQVRRRV
ncbi:receptor-type adenylate cyclase [Trypanosoma cruzi]|nr:receptor-type adenylate cyclase [Trypanosoma cruzi]